MVMHKHANLHSLLIKPGDLPVRTSEPKELIDLQCDEGAQVKFENFTLADFWLNVSSSYRTLAKNAVYSASRISNNMEMRTWVFHLIVKVDNR